MSVTGHVFIACSLDGFIARPDHSLDWLMKFDGGDTKTSGYDAFIDSIDGLVMGRGTFEKVSTFEPWPYAKPVVVISRSLTVAEIPEMLRDKVTLSSSEPRELMQHLAAKGWNRAYIDGGRLIQSFLKARLVDDMTITVAPILLGEGRRLFGPTGGDIDLELTDVRPMGPAGFAQLRYRVKR